jgi:hypothetical protein
MQDGQLCALSWESEGLLVIQDSDRTRTAAAAGAGH